MSSSLSVLALWRDRSDPPAPADRIALMGVFSSDGTTFDPRVLNDRLLTIRRIAVGSRAAFEAMNRAIVLHGLRPVVDRVYPFSEARNAYTHLEARKHVGKVVISNP